MLTEEEIQFRRTKIGASDAASILGISPWKSAHRLWKEKVLGESTPTNSSMQRGNELEPIARLEFEKMTGLSVMPKLVVHAEREWQIANLDGMTFDESVFVEIKCPNKEVHQMAIDGKLPPYYYSQMQHQLVVSGKDMAFYFSFDGSKGALVEVKREQGYIDDLCEKETEFYKWMQEKTAPPLSEKDFHQINDQEWRLLAEEYASICSLEEKKEKIRARLLELAGERNCVGFGIKVLKKHRSGSIDYQAIPEIKKIDVEKYRKKDIQYFEISLLKSC